MLYSGEKAKSAIQKDWDIKIGDKYIQVKGHSKASKNGNAHSNIKYNVNAQVDELIIIVFSEDYKLKSFYQIPWQDALSRIRKGRIYWSDVEDYKKEIKTLPNQKFISLFI